MSVGLPSAIRAYEGLRGNKIRVVFDFLHCVCHAHVRRICSVRLWKVVSQKVRSLSRLVHVMVKSFLCSINVYLSLSSVH